MLAGEYDAGLTFFLHFHDKYCRVAIFIVIWGSICDLRDRDRDRDRDRLTGSRTGV